MIFSMPRRPGKSGLMLHRQVLNSDDLTFRCEVMRFKSGSALARDAGLKPDVPYLRVTIARRGGPGLCTRFQPLEANLVQAYLIAVAHLAALTVGLVQ